MIFSAVYPWCNIHLLLPNLFFSVPLLTVPLFTLFYIPSSPWLDSPQTSVVGKFFQGLPQCASQFYFFMFLSPRDFLFRLCFLRSLPLFLFQIPPSIWLPYSHDPNVPPGLEICSRAYSSGTYIVDFRLSLRIPSPEFRTCCSVGAPNWFLLLFPSSFFFFDFLSLPCSYPSTRTSLIY